jgi:hypothetical protein
MATQSGAAPGASRACPIDSISRVYECDDELVVLLRLNEGLLELRVPRESLASEEPLPRIAGFNADATPC